ncbi:MAG TPA: hypothetical protein VIL43_05850, partial [Burkholderiales bacterium]
PVAWIEGRDLDPSPDSFLRYLGGVLGSSSEVPVEEPAVILIDGYEYLAPLDGWLRERFLPDLPAKCLVVIAGREPPAASWRTVPEWAALARILPLRNLEPEAAKAYLRRRRIAKAHDAAVLAFTHGHPLAISLVADMLAQRDAGTTFDLREQPDILRTLLDCLVRDTPGPEFRRALEVCAHARVTTESLLAHVIGGTEATRLFAWLRGLSLVEQGPHGLYPHDLVRDVLDADFRWRDPEGYRSVHRRIREHVLERMRTASGTEQEQVLFDLVYLHRHSPTMGPYYSWKSFGTAYAEPLAADGHAALLELVHAQDGEVAAATARYWLSRQPEAFYVFRGPAKRIYGYGFLLAVREVRDEDLRHDILLQRAYAYARTNAPPRHGEALLLARHWSREDRDSQAASSNLISVLSLRSWLTTPAVAWSFAAPSDPERWLPVFTHLNFTRAPDAEASFDGRRYGVFAHDWRAEPPAAWLEHMAERELGAGAAPPAPPPQSPQRLVLSQPDFAAAVRQALRDYARPAALAANPLLRSRVVLDRTSQPPSAADLQALLREGIETLRANPKDEKRYRALWHTFIQPAATQEQAAERLQLAFNTYRYHLYQGIDRVTEWLWQRELHGAA